jgi:hypothetical protein
LLECDADRIVVFDAIQTLGAARDLRGHVIVVLLGLFGARHFTVCGNEVRRRYEAALVLPVGRQDR